MSAVFKKNINTGWAGNGNIKPPRVQNQQPSRVPLDLISQILEDKAISDI